MKVRKNSTMTMKTCRSKTCRYELVWLLVLLEPPRPITLSIIIIVSTASTGCWASPSPTAAKKLNRGHVYNVQNNRAIHSSLFDVLFSALFCSLFSALFLVWQINVTE
jgi:hypothetical protein